MKSQAAPAQAPGSLPAACICPAPGRTLRMTVDAASVTALRRFAMRCCGDAFEFMRIAACEERGRSRVWLCVERHYAAPLSDAILRQFPSAKLAADSSRAAA